MIKHMNESPKPENDTDSRKSYPDVSHITRKEAKTPPARSAYTARQAIIVKNQFDDITASKNYGAIVTDCSVFKVIDQIGHYYHELCSPLYN